MNTCCEKNNHACYFGGHCPERDKIDGWSVLEWVLLAAAMGFLWLAIKA